MSCHSVQNGYEVCETDLGECIVQLRGEGPSHMVLPAIHLSRGQVAEEFEKATEMSVKDWVKANHYESQPLRDKVLDFVYDNGKITEK